MKNCTYISTGCLEKCSNVVITQLLSFQKSTPSNSLIICTADRGAVKKITAVYVYNPFVELFIKKFGDTLAELSEF